MKRKELTPDRIVPLVEERIQELETIIKQTQSFLENQVPGHIRVIKKRKHFEYYLITKKGDTKGNYLPKAQIATARKIIQQDYDKKLLKILQQQLKALQTLRHHYHPKAIPPLFQTLPAGRQQLLTPAQLPLQAFVQRWLSLQNPGNPFNTEDKAFQTAAGIYVRSKSELLIANILYAHHIPFHYEKLLQFKSGKTIYPDFTCLNITTSQQFLWEHFGLMDNPEYAEKAVFKIYQLQKEGYIMGKNFLATFETKDSPLTPQKIEIMIKEFLLKSFDS